ncbi:MAG: helicase C-terminal domain-containing protein [Kiritimatiellia bacterium]
MISLADNSQSGSLKERVAEFFAAGGSFEKAAEGTPYPFEIRPQQQAMAAAVADALAEAEHLAVEAGTGVGKTYAYLVPLILSLAEAGEGRRVAVSTHTINLQEQLIFRDLPFLARNMGLDFKAVLCKGRHNYVCLRRLETARQMSGDLFNKARERELERIRCWADSTGDGSLSDFTGNAKLPDREVWRQVCSEHDNCLGRNCKFVGRCFLMSARERAAEAGVLVLNHHLLFSDLAMRFPMLQNNGAGGAVSTEGAGILPEFGALVLDEAHNLEDVAGEHLGPRVAQWGIHHWLRRIYAPATGKGLLAAFNERELTRAAGRLWDEADRYFMELADWARLEGNAGSKRVINGRLEFRTPLAEQIGAVVRDLERLKESVEDEDLRIELNAAARRGDEIRQTLDFFSREHEKNYVYWVEREGDQAGRLALVSAPIEVAPILKNILFNSCSPVILTSATLAAGGSLEYFKKRVGAEDCREAVLGSPFDYRRQMKVFIAEDMPEPNDERFPAAVSGAVAHFVNKTNGRAFVLFTNAELMRRVAKDLEDFIAAENITALVQGEGLSRHEMLEAFRLAGGQEERQKVEIKRQKAECRRQKEEGGGQTTEGGWQEAEGGRQNVRHGADMDPKLAPRSSLSEDESKTCPPKLLEQRGIQNPKSKMEKAVLFGLDSFWMGVDVRGGALSNVIIVRLPFSVPDEPLVRARAGLIEAGGGDAFREYSLPQAILKFRQGVGRLIRTAEDEGIIVILDSRITRRWYGRHFLGAIPECAVEKVSLSK